MSSESQPINSAAFAEALKALPLAAVYAKVSEIRNSIAHLNRSNAELRLFIEESTETQNDRHEIESYIAENEGVMTAMRERIALCKMEVEERGQQWIELDENMETSDTMVDSRDMGAAPVVNGASETTTGNINAGRGAHGATTNGAATNTTNTSNQDAAHASEQQDAEVDEEGVYL